MTKEYVLKAVDNGKVGDFSNCREVHIQSWRNVVLSGKINAISFSLSRIVGDVASRFAAKYRILEKGYKLIQNMLFNSWRHLILPAFSF